MPAEPPAVFTCRVLPEWIDYNGHMNSAYYFLAFDKATDFFLDQIGIGEAYSRTTTFSIFMAEAHVTYGREVKVGDPLAFESQLIDADERRIHVFHRMIQPEAKYLAATADLLGLHVDRAGPKVVPFSAESNAAIEAMLVVHRKLPRPPQLGRSIGIGNRRNI